MPLFSLSAWRSSEAAPVPSEQPGGSATDSDTCSSQTSGGVQTPPRAASAASAPADGSDTSHVVTSSMSPLNLARRLLSPKSRADDGGVQEISRDTALKRLLTDESLADVALKGTDGVQVLSNACLLAARSDVFRSLLYDDSNGGKDATAVAIGYKGCVIQAVVEYILTDNAALVKPAVVTKGEDADFSAAAERARSIVAVVDAAKYFLLPNLGNMAEECAEAEMRSNAPLACVYLSAAVELKVSGVEEAAMDYVRSEIHFDLRDHKMAMKSLSPDALELILKDEHCEADDKGLFLFLCAWVGSGDDAEKERRKTIAAKFIRHIKLEYMDPSDLAEIVSSSGLVTDEEVLEAYKKQALETGCVVS